MEKGTKINLVEGLNFDRRKREKPGIFCVTHLSQILSKTAP